ncbi:MAG TPA: DUF302 domain-containing protein [Thermoleophilia bacterium]|nr:DUF302 domain-containing protein [Thermoleophilia bacterium]
MAVPGYAIGTTLKAPYEQVVPLVKQALNDEGFGVLCEIDVQAALKEKLGVARGRYLIIGACNPPLAHRALEAEPDLGVFLPCNVVVYEAPDGTHVSAVDPHSMLGTIANPVLDEIAAEVRGRFEQVVATLG